ncbi:MAG: glycosyltransferase family 4 protein [Kovacikia sp.]
MKILNLTTVIPSKYVTGGGDIASQHFINAMKTLGHSVTVVGYRRWGDPHPYGEDTIEVGERHIETKAAGYYPLLWAAFALFQQLPYTSAKYYSKRYIQTVKSLLSKHKYDVVILEHSSLLYWLKSTIAGHGKVVVLAHNLEHEIYLEQLKDASSTLVQWVYQREARLVKQIEDELAVTSQEIWTLTQYDADYFTKLGKIDFVRVFELPASAAEPVDPTHPKTFDIGMIGNWLWKPNADGLRYFFDQVYPHLPPQLSIQVAGRGAEWLNGKYSNVEYLGFVEDAPQFLAEAKVIAIPSIRGGGIQIKTLEAIGLGLPFVATPFALRGIAALPTTVQLAESPEQFAEYLQKAIAQPVTRSELESVKAWVQNRHTQFQRSVGTALKTLC